MKTQLLLSPLASPVFRENEEENEVMESLCDDVPEPLLLADRQFDICDMTNTATASSTSFFFSSSCAGYLEGMATRPIHSLNDGSLWQPKQHSTMLPEPTRGILVQRSSGMAAVSG